MFLRRKYLLSLCSCILLCGVAMAEDPLSVSDSTADAESSVKSNGGKPDPTGPTVYGQTGIFRTLSALPNNSGAVTVGSTVQFFKSSDFLVDGDENQRLLTRFTLAVVPFSGLEINTGFSLVANYNKAFAPNQTQSVGDPFLGVRYGYALADSFTVGGGVQVEIPTGQQFSQLSTDGISTKILLNADFRPVPEALVALNLGYHFDNSSQIFGYELNEAQRFSAGINPHDQLLISLGLAWQFGPVAPFLEYGAAAAMGGDAPGFGESPNWLTVGLRAWPLSRHSLHLLAAVDIGLAGASSAPTDKARIPPYNLILAVGYDFDKVPTGTAEPRVEIREVVKKVEVPAKCPPPPPPKPMSRIAGVVMDSQTNKPVGGAQVIVAGKEDAIFMSSAKDGKFTTCPADPGPAKITVSMEGYLDETTAVLLTSQPETPVTVALKPATGQTFGMLKGSVQAVTGGPLEALISIPARGIKARTGKKNGKFELKLATGTFDVIITRKGFVTQRRKIKLKTGDIVILNVQLYPKK